MPDPLSGLDDPTPVGASPFIGQLRMPPSAVARKGSMLGPVASGVGVALLGIFVFASLSAHRTQNPPPPGSFGNASASPVGTPGLVAAPRFGEAGMVPPAPAVLTPRYGSPMGAGPRTSPAPSVADRLHAPSLVIDLGGPGPGAGVAAALVPASGPGQAAGEARAEKDGDVDTAFTSRLARTETQTVSPTRLADNARVAPQGTIIPAVLETAINSDLPGYTRAVVSRDVRGYDGTVVLIPRGSRLIGQYRNAVAVGQSRAFVVWTRLITPAGLSLDIQSPGTDSMGRTGLEGETHTHFFSRFGNAILLSVINAGLQAGATAVGNPSTSVVIGSQAQATNVATMALQKEINVPPTVIVQQGTPIQVSIARDLDFTSVIGPSR